MRGHGGADGLSNLLVDANRLSQLHTEHSDIICTGSS
jgi:hypothetical protein